MRLLALLAAFTSSCLLAAVARAETGSSPSVDDSPWVSRPIAIEGNLSILGPTGLLGITADAAIEPWFVVNAGGGAGPYGPQLAVTPRLRLPLGERFGLGAEVGLSYGKWLEGKRLFDSGPEGRPAEWFAWLNTGLVLDYRAPRGFHMRVFAGRQTGLNTSDWNGYLGVGLGGAFKL